MRFFPKAHPQNLVCACLPLIGFALGLPSAAQSPPRGGTRPVSAEQVAPGIYWVHNVGFGAFLVGDENVIAVDTGGSPAVGQQIVKAIANVTPKPVNPLILTHGDADHVRGVSAFPAGIRIIAQDTTGKIMSAPPEPGRPPASESTAPAIRLPNHTVSRREDLTFDGVKVQLLHWAPAHTSGDLVVYLPAAELVLCGDLLVKDQHDLPLIHTEKGGTTRGWMESVEGLLALPAKRYIIGHEAIVETPYLRQQLQATTAARKRVKELYDEGKTLAQVEATVGEPLPYSEQGPHFPPLSEVIYGELKAGTY